MVVEEGGGGGLAGSRGRGRVWVGVYIALRHVGLWYYIYSQLFVLVVLVVLVVVEELEIQRVSLPPSRSQRCVRQSS